MEKAMDKLAKMNLTAENRAKLTAFLTDGKKSGKVTSKALIDVLDSMDASEELTEQIYDLLETAAIEIDVGDVLEILTPPVDNMDLMEDLPTEADLQTLEEAPLTDPEQEEEFVPDPGVKLDDPVRMYLKEIGKIPLLT